MRELWRRLFIVLLIGSLAYSKRKSKLRKHNFLKQRQDVKKVEPRKGFPVEEDRNVSKVYDVVHKFASKTHQVDGRKRHFLGHSHGVSTANVGVHPETPNVGYLDAAHGIATSLNSQQLQIGTQPQPAHHPSDDGLNPLPMYHSKDHSAESTVNAAFPIEQRTNGIMGGHIGADSHIINGRVTDGLAVGNHLDIGGAADQTAISSPNLEQEKDAFLQQQQGAINIAHGEPISQISHVHDLSSEQHVQFAGQAVYPETIGHQGGDYYHGGIELEHRLAHQEPVVISHPPIHITKQHHHASYHDVEDQGRVL